MINPRKLGPLYLALALAAAPLLAQTAQPEASPPPRGQSDAGADKAATPQQAPAAGAPAKKSTETGSGKDSPVDYRPSEEISEDLPVSFPVDI